MRTALELYSAVLRELNKFNAPDFDVADFNYWFNDSVLKWVEAELESYEREQEDSDEFRMLLTPDVKTLNEGNSTNVRKLALPEGYYRLARCKAVFRCKKDWNGFAEGAKIYQPVRRLTQTIRELAMQNSYYSPEPEDPFYEIIGQELHILFDSPSKPNESVVVESVEYAYIREPEAIELGEDYSSVKDSPFSVPVNRKLVKLCTQAFLENSASPRLQSNIAIHTNPN